MAKVNLNLEYLERFVTAAEIETDMPKVTAILAKIAAKELPGSEMQGWVEQPENYDRAEFERIKKAAAKIRDNSDVLIVIGIGGSYLGAKAVISALTPSFDANNSKPQIIFAGQNLSEKYLHELLDYLKDKDISVNVISKSGTTTEPAVAFRFIRKLMHKKYGEQASERIFATTDANKGALKELADQNDYECFVVPDDIGGRYSVLTAVGLLPIAAAGIDIDGLMAGAEDERQLLNSNEPNQNPAYKYAMVRNILYRQGKKIELLANNEPNLHYFSEWWKQLFGESEGKEGKGIFPAAVDFTTDLHSMGQYIQEGERQLFETVVKIKNMPAGLKLETDPEDLDGLNYLANKDISWINDQALLATIEAHTEGGVPNIVLELDDLSAKSIGGLIYFFESACMISAYLLGVNPFDQPGVEAYKNKMFELLGKPIN